MKKLLLTLLCLPIFTLAQNTYTSDSKSRKFVASLGDTAILTFNRTKLSKSILKKDPLFQENWSTQSTFPSLSPINENDSVYISLIEGAEEFYYNSWGRFNWEYGPRWGRMHRGIDLGLNIGDTVRASFNGIVRYAKFNTGGYGNCVIVRHFNGLETLYAHLDKLLVEPKQLVFSSEAIGLGGTTGRSGGPHLHFETRYKGKAFDPLKIFNKKTLVMHSNYIILTNKDITDPYAGKKTKKTKKTKKYHTIKSGETLSHLAAKYRTTVSKLQKLNRIKNPNKTSIGQRVRVK